MGYNSVRLRTGERTKREVPLATNHDAVLAELEALVVETYQLWDEEWVGFTWRNYTFEHVLRVRALARTLSEREGGDGLVLAFAGLLHDIAKGYDGEILTASDGQRHLDENGFWRNEFLPPARQNEVTRLYGELELARTLHNNSGARLAEVLLARRGLPGSLGQRVAEVIQAHLHAPPGAGSEERVLYDADTIDANVGLPALLRNLFINLHREEMRLAKDNGDFAGWVDGHRAEFYRWWLGEKVPTWIGSRRQMFLDRMTTPSARLLAAARYDRLEAWVQRLQVEIPSYAKALPGGGLSALDHFVENRSQPRIAPLLTELSERYAPPAAGPAAELIGDLRREVQGER